MKTKKTNASLFGTTSLADIQTGSGRAVAIKAVARKLAVLYYKLQTKGLDYVEKGIQEYEEKLVKQKQQKIVKAARNLGLELTEKQLVI